MQRLAAASFQFPFRAPAQRHAPWRSSPAERQRLLAWFLSGSTDLAIEATVERLCVLTGRTIGLYEVKGQWVLRGGRAASRSRLAGWAQQRGIPVRASRRVIPAGNEPGTFALRGPTSRGRFVHWYGEARRALLRLRQAWADHLQRTRPFAKQIEELKPHLLRTFFGAALGDIRVEYESVQHKVGKRPSRRARPILVTDSLIGEFVLALYEELSEAAQMFICAVCGRPSAASDQRKRRLCDDAACRDEWRKKHRRPEPSGASTERVRRFRLRHAARS
jgi:hypothetical protein